MFAALSLIAFVEGELPVRIAFGLVVLPGKTYLLGFVLALIPVIIMELSKILD